MKKGFTLVEILIVITIIGVIAAIAIPGLIGISSRNNTAKAKADLRSLQAATENYYLYNNGLYPAALADLTTTVPSIIKTIPKDPYSGTGAVYGYSSSPGRKYYAVYSVGPSKNGSISVTDAGVLTELNGSSCIYVSNIQEDTTP